VLERGPEQRGDDFIHDVEDSICDRLFALLPQQVLTSASDWLAGVLEATPRSGLTSFHRLQPLHQTSTGQPFDDQGAFLELRPDLASEKYVPVAVVATELLVVLERLEPMKSRQSWQQAFESM